MNLKYIYIFRDNLLLGRRLQKEIFTKLLNYFVYIQDSNYQIKITRINYNYVYFNKNNI